MAKSKKQDAAKYKGKFHIYTRKKTKKERLSSAAKAGINTGASSAVLTGLLNSGKGKWKSAGKFGLIIGPAAAAASYVAGPKTKTFVKKAEQQVIEHYYNTNRLHELEGLRNRTIKDGKMLQKRANVVAKGIGTAGSWIAGKLGMKGAAKIIGDIAQPGAYAAKQMGVKTKPNLLDQFLFFGAPLSASAMANSKGGVTYPLPPHKEPGKKKQEIRDHGYSSPGYDISPTGQKLYH
tara:strand:+ start:130 stop:834 length:705 start_codon:yes stop_codon:yes gene_type:complete